MVRVLAGLREDVGDQLRHGDGLVNPVDLRVVWFSHDCVQALVVEVDQDRILAVQDAMRPVFSPRLSKQRNVRSTFTLAPPVITLLIALEPDQEGIKSLPLTRRQP